MVGDNILIGIIDIFGDDAAYTIVILAKQAVFDRCIGRTVFVITLCLLLDDLGIHLVCQGSARLRGVPGVPLVRVIYCISQDVAGIVADIVGGTEDVVEIYILVLTHMVHVGRFSHIVFLKFLRGCMLLQIIIGTYFATISLTWQEHCSSLIGHSTGSFA